MVDYPLNVVLASKHFPPFVVSEQKIIMFGLLSSPAVYNKKFTPKDNNLCIVLPLLTL